MSDFKQKIKNARDEREKGDLNKSLEMFLEIDKNSLDLPQLVDFLTELGLTYWHLKQYTESKAMFEEAREVAEKIGNKSLTALVYRQLSRPELNEDPFQAVVYAKKARELAKESGRSDLPWFDHGVVSALISTNAPKTEIEEWFEIEALDLYELGSQNQDDVAKWVWATGMLIDRFHLSGSKSDLYLALMIAEKFSLSRRIGQIEEILTFL